MVKCNYQGNHYEGLYKNRIGWDITSLFMWFVYVHACVCICVYVHVRVYIIYYVYMCVYVYVHLCVCVYVCMCACVYIILEAVQLIPNCMKYHITLNTVCQENFMVSL